MPLNSKKVNDKKYRTFCFKILFFILLFKNKKIVIHSHKGAILAYIISNENYNKYDYWNESWNYYKMVFPCEKIIDMSGKGTVEIIIQLIKECEKLKETSIFDRFLKPVFNDEYLSDSAMICKIEERIRGRKKIETR